MKLTLSYDYLGIDQYGEKYWIKKYPRKELLCALGKKACSKMYIDDKEGCSHHIGYVVGQCWIEVFKIQPAFK